MPAEEEPLFCSCGNVQDILYSKSAYVLSYGDTVVTQDNDFVYVRRSSGALVVVRKKYVNVSY